MTITIYAYTAFGRRSVAQLDLRMSRGWRRLIALVYSLNWLALARNGGTWTFRTLDYSYLGLFVPWTVRTLLDCSYHGLFVPYLDFSYPGLFVPWTVRTLLDCSYHGLFVPSLDFSYHGLFVPWTIRTLLDCSYHGLFVPSWTFRTLDYSYHHWTIRTVMQDSQKLTFPTKMCLCSVRQ